MNNFFIIDYIAIITLLLSWGGYLLYLKRAIKNKHTHSLFSVIHNLRIHWMYNLVSYDEPKIADTQLLSSLQRSIMFYISITVFIVAGLMAMLSSSDVLVSIINQLPYKTSNAGETITYKIIIIMSMFIYTFFKLSWSIRQGRYFTIAVFGLPRNILTQEHKEQIFTKLGYMSTIAGRSFHTAYYSYYFGLSTLSWIIDPILFIGTNLLVVCVLYRREFRSKTLNVLTEIDGIYTQIKNN